VMSAITLDIAALLPEGSAMKMSTFVLPSGVPHLVRTWPFVAAGPVEHWL